MAFPSILGCQCGSQTELFNSVRQRRFRPRLLGKSTYAITVSSAFTALYKHWLSWSIMCCLHSRILCRWTFSMYLSCCCCCCCNKPDGFWLFLLLALEPSCCVCFTAHLSTDLNVESKCGIKTFQACFTVNNLPSLLPFTLLLPCGVSRYERPV